MGTRKCRYRCVRRLSVFEVLTGTNLHYLELFWGRERLSNRWFALHRRPTISHALWLCLRLSGADSSNVSEHGGHNG